jgi:hypothetical protein
MTPPQIPTAAKAFASSSWSALDAPALRREIETVGQEWSIRRQRRLDLVGDRQGGQEFLA